MKIGGITSVPAGTEAVQAAQTRSDAGKFMDMVQSLQNEKKGSEGVGKGVSGSQVLEEGRLNGDYRSTFNGTYTAASDKKSMPQGAAANSAIMTKNPKTIDRTSKLYEKSLELESYFVKMMISSMRKTVVKADGGNDYAQNMYEDMLYDEYATNMTKNAHFGLADEIYMQLA